MTPPAPILQVGAPTGQVKRLAACAVVVNVAVVVATTLDTVEETTRPVLAPLGSIGEAGTVFVADEESVQFPVRFS